MDKLEKNCQISEEVTLPGGKFEQPEHQLDVVFNPRSGTQPANISPMSPYKHTC